MDHCSNYEYILSAIREGFTSVMADGSTLPFEQNVAFTKEVVRAATVFGVDVEGELGHVGSAGNESDFCNENSYTTPEDAAAFADATGVASLAVAIGSAHGHYVKEPKLDIERLREINEATKTPLVLHGGSGIPQEQLVAAFKNGINKFNVGTEYFILNAKLQKIFSEAKRQIRVLSESFRSLERICRAILRRSWSYRFGVNKKENGCDERNRSKTAYRGGVSEIWFISKSFGR